MYSLDRPSHKAQEDTSPRWPHPVPFSPFTVRTATLFMECLPKRKACSLSDLVTLPSNQTKHGQQNSAGSKVCCDDRIQFSLPTSLRGSAFLPLSTQPSPGTRTTTDFQDSPSLYVRSPGPLCRPPASWFWEHPGSKSKARQLRVLPMDPTLSSDSPLYHEVSTIPRQKDTVPSKRKRV